MRRSLLVFGLGVLLGVLLGGAAAAPSGDCGAGEGDGGATLPAPLDLAGRPNMAAGLTFGMVPATGVVAPVGCRSPLPSVAASTTLRSESGDVLHGLPAPDILRPIDEPKRAPQFR